VRLQHKRNSSQILHGSHAAAASLDDSNDSNRISATASDLNAAGWCKSESAARLLQLYNHLQSPAAIAQCAKASLQLQPSVPPRSSFSATLSKLAAATLRRHICDIDVIFNINDNKRHRQRAATVTHQQYRHLPRQLSDV
jgi:hypothetical protein